MPFCELCELDRSVCAHGHADRQRAATASRQEAANSAPALWISPTRYAHFPGCPHKGDDEDYSRWGELNTPRAWELLGNGQQLPATGGANVVAVDRCRDCIAHGPWE